MICRNAGDGGIDFPISCYIFAGSARHGVRQCGIKGCAPNTGLGLNVPDVALPFRAMSLKPEAKVPPIMDNERAIIHYMRLP